MYLTVSLKNTGIENPTVEKVRQFLIDNRIPTNYGVVTSVSGGNAVIEAGDNSYESYIIALFNETRENKGNVKKRLEGERSVKEEMRKIKIKFDNF